MNQEQKNALAILIQAADLGFRMGAYNRHSTPNAANVNIAASQLEQYLKEGDKPETKSEEKTPIGGGGGTPIGKSKK